MLWYKGWLETRFIALLLLSAAVLPIPLFVLMGHLPNVHHSSLAQAETFVGCFAMCYSFLPILLAGSGITTPSAQLKKGLHGSMYFTLSLPVSRFRLFATRAGLGVLESIGILGVVPCFVRLVWIRPADHVSPSDLIACWVTLSVCASAFYFLGVLLSTFLDDRVRAVVNIAFVWVLLPMAMDRLLLYGPVSKDPLLAPVNIFRAMVSPLFTHSLPWASMGISLGVAAVLGWAALTVVQTREY